MTENLPTFTELVKTELQKFDEVVPKIEEIKSQFLPLTIQSIDDKVGYEQVGKALRFVVSKRTAIENKRKELKADSLAFGKAVDTRAKQITELLLPVEEHLRLEKEKIDNAVAEIERQKEVEKQNFINARHEQLIKAGMIFTSGVYYWHSRFDNTLSETLLAINLETLPEFEFNAIVIRVDKLNKEQNLKIAAEQKIREAEIEESKKLKEISEERWKQSMYISLQTLGCKISDMTGFVFYGDKSVINVWELNGINTIEDWETKLAEVKKRIAEIDKEKEEKNSTMSDKEKVTEYAKKLLEIETPELKSQKWNQEFKKLHLYIQSFI